MAVVLVVVVGDVVVVVVVVLVVSGRNVQSVSAQWVAPASTVRVRWLPFTHEALYRARQRRLPDGASSQQMTLPGRPQVACVSCRLHFARSVPPAIALWMVACTHVR